MRCWPRFAALATTCSVIFASWRRAHPELVAEVRGAGLIAGLDLRVDATPVVQAALERGLIINRTSGTVVRLLPPYIISEQHVDEGRGDPEGGPWCGEVA